MSCVRMLKHADTQDDGTKPCTQYIAALDCMHTYTSSPHCLVSFTITARVLLEATGPLSPLTLMMGANWKLSSPLKCARWVTMGAELCALHTLLRSFPAAGPEATRLLNPTCALQANMVKRCLRAFVVGL